MRKFFGLAAILLTAAPALAADKDVVDTADRPRLTRGPAGQSGGPSAVGGCEAWQPWRAPVTLRG